MSGIGRATVAPTQTSPSTPQDRQTSGPRPFTWRSLLTLLLGLWGGLSGMGLAHAASQVLVLLSEGGDAYRQVAHAFSQGLGEDHPVRIRSLDTVSKEELRPAPGDALLLVPVGLNAARMVAEQGSPRVSVLALMVHRQSFEALPWPAGFGSDRLSAIYIDQPLARSLQLIELLDPRLDRVGIVTSDDSLDTRGELLREQTPETRSLIQAQGQSVQVQGVADDRGVASALRRLLPEVDVLLLLPDSQVVNSANVRNVLLTSYRYRVPVVGFSPGLVTAGAVAAVFSTPEQIGRAGASLAAAWNPASGALPAARHAAGFDVAINERVARSLGLANLNARELHRRIEEKR